MSDSKSGSKNNLNESNMPLLDDVSTYFPYLGAENRINTLANYSHAEYDRIWTEYYKDYKFEEKSKCQLVLSELLAKQHCRYGPLR